MTSDVTPALARNASLSAGVLIASYKRPTDLARCLQALASQNRRPDDVMVIVRDGDRETTRLLARHDASSIPLRSIAVSAPGTVAARNAGLEACCTGVVAIIDDDTVPAPDWLARVVERFVEDPDLGGLGGRDRCHDGKCFDDGKAEVVGRIQWFGRCIGNHHLGSGAARLVDFLKGANMSYRASAIADIRFDSRLRGTGAVAHEDMAFSIAVRRAGWKLLYDPQIVVEHYPGQRDEARYYSVARVDDTSGFYDHAYNFAVALWDDLTAPRRCAFMAWSFLVGTGTCPGLVQAVRYTPRLGRASWQRFWLNQRAFTAAFRDMLRGVPAGRSVASTSAPPPRRGVA
jgi:GT2 family glycosyltransferase